VASLDCGSELPAGQKRFPGVIGAGESCSSPDPGRKGRGCGIRRFFPFFSFGTWQSFQWGWGGGKLRGGGAGGGRGPKRSSAFGRGPHLTARPGPRAGGGPGRRGSSRQPGRAAGGGGHHFRFSDREHRRAGKHERGGGRAARIRRQRRLRSYTILFARGRGREKISNGFTAGGTSLWFGRALRRHWIGRPAREKSQKPTAEIPDRWGPRARCGAPRWFRVATIDTGFPMGGTIPGPSARSKAGVARAPEITTLHFGPPVHRLQPPRADHRGSTWGT